MKVRASRAGWFCFAVLILGGLMVTSAFGEGGAVSQTGTVTSYTVQGSDKAGAETIDYENAIPMPMPTLNSPPIGPSEDGSPMLREGVPGYSPGSKGTGKVIFDGFSLLNAEAAGNQTTGGFEVQEFGTSNHPFTTMRVDLTTANNESKAYPFRASGKLYFKIGSSTYMCSASLIKKGVLVTAAHCVADFGQEQFYTNWQYIPALAGTKKPYGTWTIVRAYVMTSYYNGTDSCYQSGVVCANDVAVLVTQKKGVNYPGKTTGWLGYGWDGYGFTSGNIALFNQLGYPASHDAGLLMQRTDSQAFVSSTMSGNSVWGSRQTGGSSGGPEVVNLGITPVLSDGVAFGSEATPNIVVGVTSWGYGDKTVKQQGASPFKTSNVKTLVDTACAAYPAACAP